MNFHFDKYHGAGNDFIIIDDRDILFPDNEHQFIKKLCDRHFGVGANGFILLRKSKVADFKMIYYNSDGHPSSLCGNGSRCVFSFAQKHGIVGETGSFETSDGLHNATIDSNGLICIQIGDVTEIEERGDDVFLDTGSPHHVSCVAAVENIDVQQQGANIRYGAPYNTAGSNVNFVQKTAPSSFKIRTYERGVEGETLACGTGAVAAAIGVHYLGLTTLNQINIHAMGGALEVSFETTSGHYKNIWLKGPANFVFSGNFYL